MRYRGVHIHPQDYGKSVSIVHVILRRRLPSEFGALSATPLCTASGNPPVVPVKVLAPCPVCRVPGAWPSKVLEKTVVAVAVGVGVGDGVLVGVGVVGVLVGVGVEMGGVKGPCIPVPVTTSSK